MANAEDNKKTTIDQAPKMIRLLNDTKRLLHLPDMMMLKQSEDGESEHFVGLASGKTLMPGGNNVDADYWSKVKTHHVVKSWIKFGWIKERPTEETRFPEGPEAPESLAEYGTEQAKLAIAAETRPDIFRRWMKSETRSEVKQAIQRKIESVGAGA